jgi:hypothetical protein
MATTSIAIPDADLAAAKAEAERQGLNFSEFIHRLLIKDRRQQLMMQAIRVEEAAEAIMPRSEWEAWASTAAFGEST